MTTIMLALALLAAGEVKQGSHKESAFGFYKGMTLKQMMSAAPMSPTKADPYSYQTFKPPLPVSPFRHYLVSFGPRSGVCVVQAQTEFAAPGSQEQKENARLILSLLRAKYAEPNGTVEDGLKWDGAQGQGTEVWMKTNTLVNGKVNITVLYGFSNLPRCRAEMQQGL